MLPYAWERLDILLLLDNLQVTKIEGDGFCFLGAISKVLERNYDERLSVKQLMQHIMKYLCENSEKYTTFHIPGHEPTVNDTLVADVIDFFASRNYNTNIVDLLMRITADALHLDLEIYQENMGKIQLVNFRSEASATKSVKVKFTHNNIHSSGNHYDAITVVAAGDINLNILSSLATDKIISHSPPKVPGKIADKNEFHDSPASQHLGQEQRGDVGMEGPQENCNAQKTSEQPVSPPNSPKIQKKPCNVTMEDIGSESETPEPDIITRPLPTPEHTNPKVFEDADDFIPDIKPPKIYRKGTTKLDLPPPPTTLDGLFVDLTDDDDTADFNIPPQKFRRSLNRNDYTGSTESYSHSDETYVSSDGESCFSSISGSNIPFCKGACSSTGYPQTTSSGSSPSPTFTIEELKHPGKVYDDMSWIDPAEVESLVRNVCRGKQFPTWFFDRVPPKYVDSVPHDIDGIGHYKIKTNVHRWHEVTADRRHFQMLTSTRSTLIGERRIGTCEGSFFCPNDMCPFKQTSRYKQPNKVSWRNIRGRRNFKICAICDRVAQRVNCGAKKLVEFDYTTEMATVYHLGNHQCWLQVAKTYRKLRDEDISGNGSAKQIGVEHVMQFIDNGDMDGAEFEAEKWIDKRGARRVLDANNPEKSQDHNSFDAVGILKQKTDQKDKYYIYKIGNKNLGASSDHVFKSSQKLGKIAIDMDVDGPDNILQLENAYFDATFSRVHGFKSLGLWLLHPVMAKILRLASMDVRSENHEEIGLFLRYFNEMLSEIKGVDGYKFNPRYFVCDEAGANYKAVGAVYGTEFEGRRVKGCQWHYKSDVSGNSSKVCEKDREKFITTCHEMVETTTVADYNKLKAVLDKIAKDNPEIKPFVSYWDLRKSHIFKPFRGGGLPGVNLSEQGNASFKPSKTMRLVHAAKYDVATMIEQEREIALFEQNLIALRGRGKTLNARNARDREEQMKVAEDFVNILDNVDDVILEAQEGSNPEMYLPKAQSKHRAPKRAGPVTKKAGGRKTAGAKKKKEDNTDKLEEQLAMAMEVGDCEFNTTRKNKIDNPPMVTIATWRMSKCKGCKKTITPEDKEFPHNFVFRRTGVVGFFNRLTNKWVDSQQNIHIHLNMDCLRQQDSTLEKRHISANDEVFCSLVREQMVYLHEQGFLKPVAEKKIE